MSNHKNGNWRTGNAYGRVGKDTFSIDGKSWDYRDPNNYDRRRTVQRNEDEGNPNAYEFTNPLYDYAPGRVRDTAQALEIGNVNSPEEVERILTALREGTTATKGTEPEIDKKPKVKKPKSLLPKNYTPSEETTAAKNFVDQYEKSIRNSPDGLLGTGSMGESQTLKGTSFNAEDSSEENDMAQGFFQDQLLNLTEGFKKYNINTVGPNSIASKNSDLLRTFPTT